METRGFGSRRVAAFGSLIRHGAEVRPTNRPVAVSPRHRFAAPLLFFGGLMLFVASVHAASFSTRYFDVPAGSHPHDVAAVPTVDGPVYYTAQSTGRLGMLDPRSGRIEEIHLGAGSAPHGVIVGKDGAAWITDGGLNAIVRYDPKTRALRTWALPADAPNANLNTAAFDKQGRLWFTGQAGYYGRLVPETGDLKVWKAPRGRGPYGITATPDGHIYYASLAGSHIARIDTESGEATVIEPPTKDQGSRRVWSDSRGNIWVSYWTTGHVGRYDPAADSWREWKLPGDARAYAVWVDERDKVWLTEWSSNAIVRFDPETEKIESYPSDRTGATVRQLLGRRGEVWGAESGNDRLVRLSAPR
ncbi:lyase [Propionivibrio soli]|uniref:Vgb family protein n=1 Tax=Propionivibrio soli TaxID=2976531 RepID=UPI0021E7D905|nr:lyase [Propionivibrio soli]